MTRMNAMHNCKNPYQGKFHKVLCVCSAGLLRSPTIAWILGNADYNTRSCGIHDYALVPIDDVLIHWADTIVFAEQSHYNHVKDLVKDKDIYVLNVPDVYGFRDPDLVKAIEIKLKESGLL